MEAGTGAKVSMAVTDSTAIPDFTGTPDSTAPSKDTGSSWLAPHSGRVRGGIPRPPTTLTRHHRHRSTSRPSRTGTTVPAPRPTIQTCPRAQRRGSRSCRIKDTAQNHRRDHYDAPSICAPGEPNHNDDGGLRGHWRNPSADHDHVDVRLGTALHPR